MSKLSLHLQRSVCAILGAAAVSSVAVAADEAVGLEEIVVTAQKRAESIQTVPVAISAYTSDLREKVGITSVQDITNYTPGITYSASLDRMTVRGIGRNTNNLAIDPSIATYGDGFYNSSNHQADASTMFVDRVEVLRGPQGTLYGRNSIGGTLNVISKRPADEFGGEVRADLGNYAHHDLEGMITGPITDWLRFKLGAAEYRQDEGFTQNLGGRDEWGRRDNVFAQGQLAANFGDTADVWIKIEHADWDEGYGGSFGVSAEPYYTGPFAGTGLIPPASLGPSALYNGGIPGTTATPQYLTLNPRATDERTVNHDSPAHDTLHGENQYVLETVFHLGFADLKYTGGYHAYRYELRVDWDNSDRAGYTYTPPSGTNPVFISSDLVGLYVEDKRYYSNELNLISTNDGPLQYVFGVYQYDEHFTYPFDILTGQPQLGHPVCVLNAAGTGCAAASAANPTLSDYHTDEHSGIYSAAVYAQFDWKFAETWKASVGLRYTEDRKSVQEYFREVYWNPTLTGAATGAFDLAASPYGVRQPDGNLYRRLDGDWHGTTGTAGIEWTPTDSSLGYLKYSRGYKAGGINGGSIVAAPFTDPEHADMYELGWKQTFARTFQVNAAAFYINYKGSQTPFSVPVPGSPNRTDFLNIDRESYGLELETNWQATDNLLFNINYAYLKTKLKDGCFIDPLSVVASYAAANPAPCTPTNGVANSGTEIGGNVSGGSPENKASFNALYSFHFTPGSLTLSGSYVWRDDTYSSVFNTPANFVPDWGQADFRATWSDVGNNYSVIGYVRNAFDTFGYDGVAATASLNQTSVVRTLSYTNPRTYGVQFQYRFGSSAK